MRNSHLRACGYALPLLLTLTACGSTDSTDVDPTAPGETPEAELPFPDLVTQAVLEDQDDAAGHVEVYLTTGVEQGEINGVPLEMFLYDRERPGPTIRARVGDDVTVHFTNGLPEPTTVHWHGLRIPDYMDGSPRVQTPIQPGDTFTYSFKVTEPGTFWYHPHVRANEQVEKGLYGTLIVQEEENIEFHRERMLVLDDISLTSEGYAPWFANHPEIMHGRFGNTLLLNGLPGVLGYQAQVGEVERWRIVNTANARPMTIELVGGAEVRVIGTDGGLLPEPFVMTEPLEVAVGQRYDLEVRYTGGGPLVMNNVVLALDENDNVIQVPIEQMSIEQLEPETELEPRTPIYPVPEMPTGRAISREETIVFNAVEDPSSDAGVAWQLNGKSHSMDPLFTFAQGDTAIIELKNQLGPEHPFHLHGQWFEVLERNGEPANEPGLKDTALLPGMGSVKLRAYMDNPGRWMAHCHILEHAELGMMSEIVVTGDQLMGVSEHEPAELDKNAPHGEPGHDHDGAH
jgi:FtsP/CotA-like multicopper oxidase with cupredoxin domain